MAEERVEIKEIRIQIVAFNKKVDWWRNDLVYRPPECYPFYIRRMASDLVEHADAIAQALVAAGIAPVS